MSAWLSISEGSATVTPKLAVDHLERVRPVEAAGEAVAQAVLAQIAEQLGVAQRDREERAGGRQHALPRVAERRTRVRYAEHADDLSAGRETQADLAVG